MLRSAMRRKLLVLLVPIAVLIIGTVGLSFRDDENIEFHSKLLLDDVDQNDGEVEESPAKPFKVAADRTSSELADPVQLMSDGEPIDIGKLSRSAHAGPCMADIDGDGDRDLLVGDFPGNFWYFENTGNDKLPRYASVGKLQAGGEDARTPIY